MVGVFGFVVVVVGGMTTVLCRESKATHCAGRLAPYKVPKAIAFAPALPRTASGKLVRSRLAVDGSGATP